MNTCVRDVSGLCVMIAHPSKLEAIGLILTIDFIGCAPSATSSLSFFNIMPKSIESDGVKIQIWPNYG